MGDLCSLYVHVPNVLWKQVLLWQSNIVRKRRKERRWKELESIALSTIQMELNRRISCWENSKNITSTSTHLIGHLWDIKFNAKHLRTKTCFCLTLSTLLVAENNTRLRQPLPLVLERSSSWGWKLFRREISQGQML